LPRRDLRYSGVEGIFAERGRETQPFCAKMHTRFASRAAPALPL
jgi:hypothetical protein